MGDEGEDAGEERRMTESNRQSNCLAPDRPAGEDGSTKRSASGGSSTDSGRPGAAAAGSGRGEGEGVSTGAVEHVAAAGGSDASGGR
jgi:hypothetical protein